jgi:hypothetical protein
MGVAMSGSNSSFFNGSVLPWNWGGASDPSTNWTNNLNYSLGPNKVGDPGYVSPAGMQSQFDNPLIGSIRSDLGSGSGIGANANSAFGTGLGWNVGTGQLAMSGLGALGNLWSAYQANNMAKQQLDFTKGVTNTNLANQIKSYNTALTDRSVARGKAEGMSQDDVNAYIARNSLAR